MEKVINLGKEGEEKVIMLAKEATVVGGAVDSVNGQTGDVVITASDLITAGEGLSLVGDELSIDSSIVPTMADLDTKQNILTAGDGITIEDDTISATGGGGSGDSVYSDKTTSNLSAGGAVYIGNLNASQQEQPDPTTTDNHFKYFWALPYMNTTIPQQRSVNIMGSNASTDSVVIGDSSNNPVGANSVAIGGASVRAQYGVGIGYGAYINNNLINAIALGSRSNPTRSGEVNIGSSIGSGYNNTNYRVLGGVHDGQLANDAVTVGQLNATIDAINTALGANIPHVGA